MTTTRDETERLKAKVDRLHATLGSLISWIAQSAGSPISRDDAKQLLRMLDGPEDY